MIASTAKLLKEQGAAIQKESINANISPDTLKQAFSDTLSALNDITAYKTKALPQMERTIQEFYDIAREGERQLNSMEKSSNMKLWE